MPLRDQVEACHLPAAIHTAVQQGGAAMPPAYSSEEEDYSSGDEELSEEVLRLCMWPRERHAGRLAAHEQACRCTEPWEPTFRTLTTS